LREKYKNGTETVCFLKKFFIKMMKMFYVLERKTLKLGFEKEQ